MKPYSLILFDYDGTLCDSREAILTTFERTFRYYQEPVPPAETLHQVVSHGLIMPEAFRVLKPGLTPEEITEWVTTYRNLYDQDAYHLVKPFPGAQELLAHLQERGKTLVVMSNKGIRSIEMSLDYLGFSPYLTLSLGDGSPLLTGLDKKPNPISYTQVIQPRFAPIPAASTLMIGDTTMDIQYANNCGIDSCWAAYGFGSAEAIRPLKPTYEVNALVELKKIIE